MNPEEEFYDRLIALTTHIYQELEELNELRTGQEIRNIDTMYTMLGSMQVLTVSVDTIAKTIKAHIEDEKED